MPPSAQSSRLNDKVFLQLRQQKIIMRAMKVVDLQRRRVRDGNRMGWNQKEKNGDGFASVL